MKRIAIIPARGGSKRIPRKNIKIFLGKPIIYYSIKAAFESKLFDKIIVSTDDQEIALISKKNGAEVPFLRSSENSNDYSGTGEVLYEVLEKLEQMEEIYEVACCIYPTAPLITKELLNLTFEKFKKNEFDVIFPVAEYSVPIERALILNKSGKVKNKFSESNDVRRSQDLKSSFFDIGSHYWFYPKNLKKIDNKNLFGLNRGAIVVNQMLAQDIDNFSDWDLAELKFKYIQNDKKIF
jgi:pseudaminic acid cytidylyltransferase